MYIVHYNYRIYYSNIVNYLATLTHNNLMIFGPGRGMDI